MADAREAHWARCADGQGPDHSATPPLRHVPQLLRNSLARPRRREVATHSAATAPRYYTNNFTIFIQSFYFQMFT